MQTGFSFTQHTAFTGHWSPTQETSSSTWLLTQVPSILVLAKCLDLKTVRFKTLVLKMWIRSSMIDTLGDNLSITCICVCVCMISSLGNSIQPTKLHRIMQNTQASHLSQLLRKAKYVMTTPRHVWYENLLSNFWSPSFLYFTMAHQLPPLTTTANQQTSSLLQGKMSCLLWHVCVSSPLNVCTTLYHFY